MLGHEGEPIGFDNLYVVVQKEQPGTLGLLDGEIVERRIIERPFITQQPVFGPSEVSAHLLRSAIVADNDDLIIRIACPVVMLSIQHARSRMRWRSRRTTGIRLSSASSRLTHVA